MPLDTAIVDVRRTFAGAELRTLLWSLLAAVSFVVCSSPVLSSLAQLSWRATCQLAVPAP